MKNSDNFTGDKAEGSWIALVPAIWATLWLAAHVSKRNVDIILTINDCCQICQFKVVVVVELGVPAFAFLDRNLTVARWAHPRLNPDNVGGYFLKRCRQSCYRDSLAERGHVV